MHQEAAIDILVSGKWHEICCLFQLPSAALNTKYRRRGIILLLRDSFTVSYGVSLPPTSLRLVCVIPIYTSVFDFGWNFMTGQS